MEMNSLIHSADSVSGSRSDWFQSSVSTEVIVGGDDVNTTINRDASMQITNDGGAKNNRLERGRNRKIRKMDSVTMKAVGQHVGKPTGQAAESFGVSTSTLMRFCREHGITIPKHDKRTVSVSDSKWSQEPESKGRVNLFVVVLLLVRIKRWSFLSKRHGLSGKWWTCGQHVYPPPELDSMYLIEHATQKKDYLVMSPKQIVASVVSDNLDGASNKPIRKRKRTVLSSGMVEIREHCGKAMEKAVANLGDVVGISKLRGMFNSLGMQWWPNKKQLIQANVVSSTSAEAPNSVFAASSEPLATTNVTHDHPTLVHQQQQTNLPDGLAQFRTIVKERFIENATASAVKKLIIKAKYEENMVKFSFTLLDGLVKLKEMVATRFQLRLESFKLKYQDEDGDMILIACDTDLMLLVDDPKQPIKQPVTRLLVLSI